MEDATLTVQYVNEPKPGKKLGNIKDTNGQPWLVVPSMLPRFAEGETYKVEYTESHADNGMIFRHVKNLYQAEPSRAMQTPPERTAPIPQSTRQTNGKKMDQSNFYRPTSPRDSERMFVCSTLNAFISTGRVNNEVEVLVEYVNALRQVYQRTFGADDDIMSLRQVNLTPCCLAADRFSWHGPIGRFLCRVAYVLRKASMPRSDADDLRVASLFLFDIVIGVAIALGVSLLILGVF